MATATYIAGRRKYQRPQAMLWAENSGTLVSAPTQTDPNYKVYVPNGLEVGQDPGSVTDPSMFDQFMILSDDNRQPIEVRYDRLEKRERMINGRMRSHHIADKLVISTGWDLLPSRSHALRPNFNPTTGKSELTTEGYRDAGSDGSFKILPNVTFGNQQYTTDGGAGGAEILRWYEEHKGSFWVYLAYDKHTAFGDDDSSYGHLPQYNQLVEMFISDFSYSIEKRGGTTHDLWNISVTLEEV